MGPEMGSDGHVTEWDPPRRIVYEEDWAALMGQEPDALSPLTSEFLVEAQSGGTCVVRVTSSGFGTGADWESEFWDDMGISWKPFFDNLRLYLSHFPGKEATVLEATASHPGEAETLWSTLHHALGLGDVGSEVDVRGATGTVERVGERQTLVRLTAPVPGMLSVFAHGEGDGRSATGLPGVPLLPRRGGLRTTRGAGLAGLAGRALRAGLSSTRHARPRGTRPGYRRARARTSTHPRGEHDCGRGGARPRAPRPRPGPAGARRSHRRGRRRRARAPRAAAGRAAARAGALPRGRPRPPPRRAGAPPTRCATASATSWWSSTRRPPRSCCASSRPTSWPTAGPVTIVGLPRAGRPVAVRRAAGAGVALGLVGGPAAVPAGPLLTLVALLLVVGGALALAAPPLRHVGRELLLVALITVGVGLVVVASSARFPGGW